MKKLPLGIQTFEKLRAHGYEYVDKTEYILEILTSCEACFLARPRRFGKSLLVSTFRAVFEGRKDLFTGLDISKTNFSWSEHPVIHLDFSPREYLTEDAIDEYVTAEVDRISERYGVIVKGDSYETRFTNLIVELYRQASVVILVDEYDAPILGTLNNPELCVRVKNRLRAFYSCIKSCDQYLRFVFLTGVSKFAKISVFSGLNNLVDLTMHPKYGGICGYSKAEIENTFDGRIRTACDTLSLDHEAFMEKLQEWYNGYRFSESPETMFNPVSVMNLLDRAQFHPYWFETATPTFLIDLVRKQGCLPHDLERITVQTDDLASFEVDNLRIEPLLFQTGYVTITGYEPSTATYTLGYPNREVRQSFLYSLSSAMTGAANGRTASELGNLGQSIQSGDIDGFMESLKVFFAGIPYDIQIANEKYYQTIFYLVFSLLGYRIQVEHRTSKGRIDAIIETDSRIFLFEFKLLSTAESALAQIREREYFHKFKDMGKPILLVGVSFSKEERNIDRWIVEEA